MIYKVDDLHNLDDLYNISHRIIYHIYDLNAQYDLDRDLSLCARVCLMG